jgi:CHAT domain-containing protein
MMSDTMARTAQFYRMDAESMFELASLYRTENKIDLAEESLKQGIAAGYKIGDRFFLPRDLAALAEIKDREGEPEAAEALYEQATDVLDGLLINSASPDAKSSIVAAMSDIYIRHFALAVRLRHTSEAFAIVERARGRTAADLLRASFHRPIEAPNGTPSDRSIANLQLRLLHSVSVAERKEILADLFDAEQKRFLEAGTQSSRTAAHPIDISDLRRVLHPDELLLEYVVSDTGSYCLAVSRLHSALIRLTKGRAALERAVRSYLSAVRKKEDAEVEERQLYSTLLGSIPAVQSKLRLIVVPDGSLNLLPFDSLRDPDGKYALYSHVITYVPSGTVLYVLRTKHRSLTPSLPFLGVGDVSYSSAKQLIAKTTNVTQPTEVARGIYDLAGADFPELPGTKQEIEAVGRLFGSKSVLLMGAYASEAAFKAEPLANFKVIHLAVHSVAAPKYPERAALVLGSDPQNHDDGLLQAREITTLSLNADLVTLSACDTGTGRLEGEEGVNSLERAFLVAGAKTVVATLWSADDIFAPALIKAFYQHIANHEDKGAALRNAKLDMIRQFGPHAPPFYWAGFTMNGDSTSTISTSIQ